MKKILTFVLFAFVLMVFTVLFAGIYKFNFTDGGDIMPPLENKPTITQNVANVKNISYTINGQTFTLLNGSTTKRIENSSSEEKLSVFGEPVYGDLTNDGVEDAAIMLTYSSGGTGTFYYAVLAIATGTTYTSTNALLLGDRIAPQTVEIHNGNAVYNYATRKETEPMTTKPSVSKSLFIHYDKATKEIGELVQNFEGEADPALMTLEMKKWTWVKTQMNNGSETVPKKADAFTLTFTKDGHVAITTDCNGMGGSYTTKGKNLTFSQMMSTLMYCDGSQEQEFASKLSEVKSYLFTSKGELILEIKMDSGTMTFR